MGSPPGRIALFALLALVFFATASGKRGVYLMESFPAISLLIAAAVVKAGFGRVGFVLMAVLGVVLGVVARRRPFHFRPS